jgi:hypothetical protein
MRDLPASNSQKRGVQALLALPKTDRFLQAISATGLSLISPLNVLRLPPVLAESRASRNNAVEVGEI